MSQIVRSFEEPSINRFASHPPGFAASLKSSSRAQYRPPPILLVEGKDGTISGSRTPFGFSPQSTSRPTWTGLPKSPLRASDFPAFITGDLNRSTLCSRATAAVAEGALSPTDTHRSSSYDSLCPTKPSESNSSESSQEVVEADPASSEPSSALLHPHFRRHSHSHVPFTSPPATPFTPLTPVPFSSPQHRTTSSVQSRPSLKASRVRHRPCPLQLTPQSQSIEQSCDPTKESSGVTKLRSVRFEDGSPLRGTTWHLSQYPERLASPPISAASLSLADLVELESIKQSLGTWCGEMMGSFVHGSSNSEPQSVPDASPQPAVLICSPPYSDADWQARWPISPAFSDCDSEIFEGMH